MSTPRPVVAGQVVLLTRKCVQAQLLLTPDGELNTIILYNLQLWAMKHGVVLHAICVESNHYHAVVGDGQALLPEFCRDFHSFVARAINLHHDREGALWDEAQTSVVVCATPEAAFAELIYTVTNPAKDHLVERAHQWPGVNSLTLMFRGPQRIRRPRQVGHGPESVELEFARLPGFEHLSDDEWADKVRTAVRAVEEAAAQERADNRAAYHRAITEAAAQRAADKEAARDRARQERQLPAAAPSPAAPNAEAPSPAAPTAEAPSSAAPNAEGSHNHFVSRGRRPNHRRRGQGRAHAKRHQRPRPAPRGVTRVLGCRAIRRQDPFSSPPPKKKKRGRQLNPTVAAKDPQKHRELLHARRAWRAAYRSAFEAHQNGEREVAFPFGTWQRRVHSAVRCNLAPGLLPIPYALALRTA